MSTTTQRSTPETDAAIRKTWPADAVAIAIKLERERDEAREYAERCKQGCINLSFAIDRIDYACGEPNEFEVSDYALHQNEEHVVQRVKEKLEAMRNERDQLSRDLSSLLAGDCLDGHDAVEGVQNGIAMREAIKEAHACIEAKASELIPSALAKLQPFLKP